MKFKKTLTLSLIIVMLLSMTVNLNVSAAKYTDIGGHWAEDIIEKLSDKGIIDGNPDGTFKPDDTIQVCEFLKLITVCVNSSLKPATTGKWYQTYLDFAMDAGLVKTEDKLEMERPITRSEMARLIARAMDYNGEEYPEDIEKYSWQLYDFYQQPYYMQDYISKAYIKGIIAGYPDKTFKGDANATRAEASTMILRFIEPSMRIAVEDREPTKYEVKPLTDVEYLKFVEDREHVSVISAELDSEQNKFRFTNTWSYYEKYRHENYEVKDDINKKANTHIYALIKTMANPNYYLDASYCPYDPGVNDVSKVRISLGKNASHALYNGYITYIISESGFYKCDFTVSAPDKCPGVAQVA